MADDVIIADTPEQLADRVAADFARLVEETLAKQDKFSIALAGGVTTSLAQDIHGKSYSNVMLAIEHPDPVK